MLGKWIYFGAIEDDFEEFMISETKIEIFNDPIYNRQNQNYDWDERFQLRSNLVSKKNVGKSNPKGSQIFEETG
jgi:hypothetical protein